MWAENKDIFKLRLSVYQKTIQIAMPIYDNMYDDIHNMIFFNKLCSPIL